MRKEQPSSYPENSRRVSPTRQSSRLAKEIEVQLQRQPVLSHRNGVQHEPKNHHQSNQVQPAATHVQAYAAFTQNNSDAHNSGRRSSHDIFSGAIDTDASSHNSARYEVMMVNSDSGGLAKDFSGNSSSSSSVRSLGADVGVIGGDGRFISSLMGAQQARMRVYV